MKIAMLSWELRKPCGGMGNHVYYLSRELAKKHEIFLIVPAKRNFSKKNIKQFPTSIYRGGNAPLIKLASYFATSWKKALEIINKYDIDLVHSHHASDLSVPKKIPTVNTAHHIGILLGNRLLRNESLLGVSGEDFVQKVLGGLGSMVINQTYSRSDKIIAVSQFQKDILKSKNIGGKKIEVIPNGVNTERFKPRDTSLKERYNADNLVLYLGRLSKMKGVHRLIRNARKIIEENTNTKILIVGRGGYRKQLVKMRNKLDLKEDVFFLNYTFHPDKFYNLADIYVLPSIFESFGMTVLEAMACGTPVVASKNGGTEEIITNGEDGFLFGDEEEMVDKINFLLENKALRKKLGKKARNKILRKFSWQKVAKRTEKLYEKVLRASNS